MTNTYDLYQLLIDTLAKGRGYDEGLISETVLPSYNNFEQSDPYGYIHDIESPVQDLSFLDNYYKGGQNIQDYKSLAKLSNWFLNHKLGGR